MGANFANFSFSTPKRQKWCRLFSPLLIFHSQNVQNGVEKSYHLKFYFSSSQKQ